MQTKKDRKHDHKILANRLKYLREEILKKTQEQMAKELNITQASVSAFEKVGVVPNGRFFVKLAARFPEINFNWLIQQEGGPLKEEFQNSLDKAKLKSMRKSIMELEAEFRTRHVKNSDY